MGCLSSSGPGSFLPFKRCLISYFLFNIFMYLFVMLKKCVSTFFFCICLTGLFLGILGVGRDGVEGAGVEKVLPSA